MFPFPRNKYVYWRDINTFYFSWLILYDIVWIVIFTQEASQIAHTMPMTTTLTPCAKWGYIISEYLSPPGVKSDGEVGLILGKID